MAIFPEIEFDPRIPTSFKNFCEIIKEKNLGVNNGGAPRDRTVRFDHPWLTENIAPIPPLSESPRSFDQVFDKVIADLIKNSDQRKIFLKWSGGIDSTAVAVGLLKNLSSIDYQRVTVLCNDASIHENSYFYHRFLKPNFNISNIDDFTVKNLSLDDFVMLDGECGNQILSHGWITKLYEQGRYHLVHKQWQDLCVPEIFNLDPKKSQPWLDMIIDTIPRSPVPIITFYDFAWWSFFVYKFENMLWADNLSYLIDLPVKSRKFYIDHVSRHPFADPRVQQWSMQNLDYRREKDQLSLKWPAKNYIYSLDKNPYYLHNKTIIGSNMLKIKNRCIFALDEDWNCYEATDPNARRKIWEFIKSLPTHK